MNQISKNLFITVILLIIILSGCGQKKTEKSTNSIPQSKADSIKFTPKELVKSYNNCGPGDLMCTFIKLNYIEATEGKIKEKINKIINDRIINAYEMPDKNFDNVNLMMETFIRDFETFKKQFPGANQQWIVDYAVSVHGQTDKVLCLSFFNSSYLGGAHPMTNIFFSNINKETGDTLSLVDLFGKGFENKLNSVIDKNFREQKELKPGDNLSDKGGLFKNKIIFTDNFAVTSDKGIEFFYNPYDIAPYAMGTIVVRLSPGDAAGLMTGASLLK